MSRHRRQPDDDDEDEFDDDYLPDGVYHDDEPVMVSCPYCRESVYEEAQYCPRCENYISAEGPPDRKPTWIWVCLILATLSAILMAFY